MTVLRALPFAVLLAPFAALAGPAVVTSGEHAGFTRLVVQFDGPVNWQIGRALDGYILRVQDQTPDYDITKAFDLIGKSRLAALAADPKTGELRFGVACACYAIPFEFRPGIVVVDLHDGPPPKGSAFEQPLDSPAPTDATPVLPMPVQAMPAAMVTPDPYDWTKLALDRTYPPISAALPADPGLSVTDTSLQPLRQALIEEMSRGASEGIVDMAKPKKPVALSDAADPSVQIHLGETPDLIIRQKGQGTGPLTAKGATCLSDDQLDVPSWGSDRPVSDQIGPERQGLTGEFDKPDPDAVTRAIRFDLFLSFGAEAMGLARSFPGNLPDLPVWQSMAHVLDDTPDPKPAFAGMEECGGTAALWATLADPAARPTVEIAKAAVLHSFSALPAHLRRLLGPRLVDRFLAVNDISVATALRDAVLRAPGDPGPAIVLMQAAMDRALGKPGKSEAQLEPIANAAGPAAADALVDLVEQRAALGQSVDYNQVQMLQGYLKEREGSDAALRFRHALILAYAASGDFDKAFAEVDQAPDATKTLWNVLAQAGPDGALLTHATLAEGDAAPMEAKAAASLIADRMLGLGLADEAARWLKLDDHAPALLTARIALAQGDADGALSLLQRDNSDMAMAVKATALQTKGDEKGAADIFAKLGKTEAEWLAVSRSQDWNLLAEGGPDPWKALAAIVVPPKDGAASGMTSANPAATAPDGPLARNKALVQDSAATRDAITALLNAVKPPDLPTQ